MAMIAPIPMFAKGNMISRNVKKKFVGSPGCGMMGGTVGAATARVAACIRTNRTAKKMLSCVNFFTPNACSPPNVELAAREYLEVPILYQSCT